MSLNRPNSSCGKKSKKDVCKKSRSVPHQVISGVAQVSSTGCQKKEYKEGTPTLAPGHFRLVKLGRDSTFTRRLIMSPEFQHSCSLPSQTLRLFLLVHCQVTTVDLPCVSTNTTILFHLWLVMYAIETTDSEPMINRISNVPRLQFSRD